MNISISNQHLMKIIYQYVDIKHPYINELLEKTKDLLEDTSHWYTYDSYTKCTDKNDEFHWFVGRMIHHKFKYNRNYNSQWCITDF